MDLPNQLTWFPLIGIFGPHRLPLLQLPWRSPATAANGQRPGRAHSARPRLPIIAGQSATSVGGEPAGRDHDDHEEDDRNHDPEHDERGRRTDVVDHPAEVHPEEPGHESEREEDHCHEGQPFTDRRRTPGQRVAQHRVELGGRGSALLEDRPNPAQLPPRRRAERLGEDLVGREHPLLHDPQMLEREQPAA